MLATALTTLLLLAVVASGVYFGWYRYQKVYLRGDYRAGYAVGQQWRVDRAERTAADCASLAVSYAGDPQSVSTPRFAFRMGCFDGLTGAPDSSSALRARLVMPGN